MIVRRATGEDAVAGSDVLRRSITELCHADHRGDMTVIASWTANKTADDWRNWVTRHDIALLVAEAESQILGVALTTRDGEIRLNYVSPDARWLGVSKALLSSAEHWAKQHGAVRAALESTKTAERFYRAAGYITDRSRENDGLWMSKLL